MVAVLDGPERFVAETQDAGEEAGVVEVVAVGSKGDLLATCGPIHVRNASVVGGIVAVLGVYNGPGAVREREE